MTKILTILSAIFVLLGMGAVAQDRSRPQEQVHFSAEDEDMKRPVRIPDDAWSVLMNDPDVIEVLKNENPPPSELPRNWFTASEIHLGGPKESDLVVAAKSPLSGANVTTFWVFLHTRQGLKLVLSVPAHDLIIKSSSWNGHRIIEASSVTAVQVLRQSFRFDGSQYRANERTARHLE